MLWLITSPSLYLSNSHFLSLPSMSLYFLCPILLRYKTQRKREGKTKRGKFLSTSNIPIRSDYFRVNGCKKERGSEKKIYSSIYMFERKGKKKNAKVEEEKENLRTIKWKSHFEVPLGIWYGQVLNGLNLVENRLFFLTRCERIFTLAFEIISRGGKRGEHLIMEEFLYFLTIFNYESLYGTFKTVKFIMCMEMWW